MMLPLSLKLFYKCLQRGPLAIQEICFIARTYLVLIEMEEKIHLDVLLQKPGEAMMFPRSHSQVGVICILLWL